MFNLDSKALDVINFGLEQLNLEESIPEEHQCKPAEEAIVTLNQDNPLMTAGEFCEIAKTFQKWAGLCSTCLEFNSIQAELNEELQLVMLEAASSHFTLANKLYFFFGDSLPEPYKTIIKSQLEPRLQDYVNSIPEIQHLKRNF
ncbi:hypothetical protein [Picosynechococcus sp. PCC 7117]|uniref:hypothetical protein n=1 Tax=Picosynechococcus sp. PCC 7117 TaxID=195498 RepID=UPI000810DF7C|nr:hypothetical protein [Picosynechococcus sp. PCC 7117]ANV88506.1 hypothetical protein AWQ22_14120 [Picosynechococcus sp. PCC 7117]